MVWVVSDSPEGAYRLKAPPHSPTGFFPLREPLLSITSWGAVMPHKAIIVRWLWNTLATVVLWIRRLCRLFIGRVVCGLVTFYSAAEALFRPVHFPLAVLWLVAGLIASVAPNYT